jgi:hypothetical protein
MDDKITIIEGPTPTFDEAQDAWAMGIYEGPAQYGMAITRLRTFNGPALVERCYRAWKNQDSISLEYKDELGLPQTKPIVAVRKVDTEDGQVLLVWLRIDSDDEVESSSPGADADDGFSLD